jgi:hypothetical protein
MKQAWHPPRRDLQPKFLIYTMISEDNLQFRLKIVMVIMAKRVQPGAASHNCCHGTSHIR